MEALKEAFLMTAELWVFLGVLCLACGVEDLLKFYKSRTVDNPTLQ